MSAEERIIALEQQLIDCRRAAVSLMLDMARTIAKRPEAREELARGLDDAAAACADPETIRLARLMAQVLRRE